MNRRKTLYPSSPECKLTLCTVVLPDDAMTGPKNDWNRCVFCDLKNGTSLGYHWEIDRLVGRLTSPAFVAARHDDNSYSRSLSSCSALVGVPSKTVFC